MAKTSITLPLKKTTLISGSPNIEVNPVSGGYNIDFNTSGLAAESSSSIIRTFTAGETISALQAVYYDNSTGKIFKGDSSQLVSAGIVGIAINAGLTNSAIQVLQYGLLTDSAFNFNPGDLIFITQDGIIDSIAPNSGYLTRLGRAITNNSLLILIENPITL